MFGDPSRLWALQISWRLSVASFSDAFAANSDAGAYTTRKALGWSVIPASASMST
jgi:hypothetical protein